jgi:type IV secretory pathway protease TraF
MLRLRRSLLVFGSLLAVPACAWLFNAFFAINTTPSVPIGLYVREPCPPSLLNTIVRVKAPEPFHSLAVSRGYFADTSRLLKPVVAENSGFFCVSKGQISLNGQPIIKANLFDYRQRPVPLRDGCEQVGDNNIILLVKHLPNSFDSRVFGPLRRSSVEACFRPLWLQ